jgi:hypothetical protein
MASLTPSEGGREEIGGVVLEEIMSVSVEKDWLFKDGELIGHTHTHQHTLYFIHKPPNCY